MTAFATALWAEEGNDDPTVEVVLTSAPLVTSAEYRRGYESALSDLGGVLRDEVSMPDSVLAYFLDLARARERAR